MIGQRETHKEDDLVCAVAHGTESAFQTRRDRPVCPVHARIRCDVPLANVGRDPIFLLTSSESVGQPNFGCSIEGVQRHALSSERIPDRLIQGGASEHLGAVFV